MSILIRGMEMPKNCLECFFHKDVDIGVGIADGCEWLKGMIYNPDERLEDCPLVPVPPHGRLIDADVLLEHMKKVHDKWKMNGHYTPTTDDEIMTMNMPTVIEAEGEA